MNYYTVDYIAFDRNGSQIVSDKMEVFASSKTDAEIKTTDLVLGLSLQTKPMSVVAKAH